VQKRRRSDRKRYRAEQEALFEAKTVELLARKIDPTMVNIDKAIEILDREDETMTVEHLVKRTIYVSQCECGERDVKDENPPRERMCKCGQWVPYVVESFTGPNTFDGKPERASGVKRRI